MTDLIKVTDFHAAWHNVVDAYAATDRKNSLIDFCLHRFNGYLRVVIQGNQKFYYMQFENQGAFALFLLEWS